MFRVLLRVIPRASAASTSRRLRGRNALRRRFIGGGRDFAIIHGNPMKSPIGELSKMNEEIMWQSVQINQILKYKSNISTLVHEYIHTLKKKYLIIYLQNEFSHNKNF